MTFHDREPRRRGGHRPIPAGSRSRPAVAVDDQTRQLVAAVLERYPRFGPKQIEAELRRRGRPVSLDAIRSVLSE